MEYGIQNSIEQPQQYVDQVFQVLLESISLGKLKPGERIRQNELADSLGVSRQPVSHALQILKSLGLVTDSGKQGVAVAPIDPRYISHLYRARLALEAMAVELATERVARNEIPAVELQKLDALVEQGEQGLQNGWSAFDLVKLDFEFHKAIYRLSGNPAIETMLTNQWPHLMRSMLAILEMPGVQSRAWVEHAAIVQALKAGQVEAAKEQIIRHLERAAREWGERLSAIL